MKEKKTQGILFGEQNEDQYQSYLNSVNRDKRIRPPGVLNILLNLPITKVIKFGEKEKFQFNNLFSVDKQVNHSYMGSKYHSTESKILQKHPNASFKRIVILTVIYDYLMANGIFGFTFILQIFTPIIFKKYLQWLQDEDAAASTGWFYLVLLLIISYSKPICTQQAIPYIHKCGIKIEMAVRVSFDFNKIAKIVVFDFILIFWKN